MSGYPFSFDGLLDGGVYEANDVSDDDDVDDGEVKSTCPELILKVEEVNSTDEEATDGNFNFCSD